MRKNILMAATLLAGLLTASAALNPYSWQRFDVYKNPGFDGSGNNHPIIGGFSGNGEAPYNTVPVVGNICVGGPLGPQGYFSSYSLRSGANAGANQGCLFEEPVPVGALTNTSPWGNFFQTNANWAVECWFLPSGNGANFTGPIFATGLNRNSRSPNAWNGVVLMSINGASGTNGAAAENDGNCYVRCQAICPPGAKDTNGNTMNFYIGPAVLVKTPTNAAWMHFAVVRDDLAGTVAWYTNGTMVASTPSWRVYSTNVYSSPGFSGIQDSGFSDTTTGPDGNQAVPLGGGAQTLRGYMAELRWSSFDPGTFSVNDLLTRRVSVGSSVVSQAPAIVQDPQSIAVWAGGSAPFRVIPATDTSLTYQWLRGGNPISGATSDTYVLPNAQAGDSSAQFNCVVTGAGGSTMSGPAILTVVSANPSLAAGYSNAVVSEPSVLAYFPMDNSSGTNLVNVVDHAHNGIIWGSGFLNGDTNKNAGTQTLSLNTPNMPYFGGYALTNGFGYAEIQGDNPGFQFPGGSGTVEAVLYMEPSAKFVFAAEQPCWLSSVTIPGTYDFYQFRADYYGNIYYQSSVQTTPLVWIVPGGLVGKRTHVAITFDNQNHMTCYANGVSLGTKTMAGLGNTPPDAFQPIWIGRRDATPENGNNGGVTTANNTGYFYNMWRGSVDEVAMYGAALSADTISAHYYRLNNGTANNPASIAQISPSKSLYAGFQVQNLSVTASGLAPFSYQWYSNNIALPGATSNSFPVSTLAVGTYNYSVSIQGAIGGAVTSAPIVLNVITPTDYAAKVFGSSGGGPVAYYPLNEASGNVVFDWAGTHDGILTGGYMHDPANGPVPGSTGSLRMFGTNSLNEFSQAQVPYYPELNPISGQFSWEFWYRLDSATASSCVMSSMYNIGNNKAGPSIYVGFGTTGFNQTTINNWTVVIGRFNNVNQGVGQNVNGSGVTVPVTNQWYHIAFVVNGTPGGGPATTTLFVNGSLEYTDGTGYSLDPNAGFVWNQNTLAPLILGNRNLGALPMNGALSEVAIYNYPLTLTDITNHTSQIWTPASFVTQTSGSQLNPNAASVTGYITNGTAFVVTNVAYGPLSSGYVLAGPGIIQGTKISGGTPTNFTVSGFMSGNVLTVTNAPLGTIAIGDRITGNSAANNPMISAFGTGTGGVGTYTLSVGGQNTALGNFTDNYTDVIGTMLGNVLTVTVAPRFPLSIGQKITGNNSISSPVIIGYGTGTGGVGTYILSVPGQSASLGFFTANPGGVGVYTLSISNNIAGAVSAIAGPIFTEGVGNSITLNAGSVLGIPNTYQWQLDGANLSPVLNFDTTPHYPRVGTVVGDSQGVYSPKLVITELTTNDTGFYNLQVSNPLNPGGTTNSITIYVLVTNDFTKPTVTSALVKSTMVSGPVVDDVLATFGSGTPAPLSIIEVKFSKRVDPASATNLANYALTGGVTITNAVLANSVTDTKFGGAFQTVGLVTTGLAPASSYTLTVSGVADEATVPNVMAAAQNIPLTTPPLSAGRAVWDYYYQVTGGYNALASGTNSVFPYVPQATGALTNFSSDAIGFDPTLNNNPLFTGQADNYVSVISAWITPTNTGYYQFFINADDKARLYLNQNGSDPAHAAYIGESYSGGTQFNDAYAIGDFLLTAGQPYFLQTVHYEINGSDYVRVGWRYLGTVDQAYDGTGANGAWTIDATNLPPIEGKFLSAYLFGAPAIAVQPQSFIAPAGVTTNLSVVVASTGTGITNYQWQLNGVNQSGKTAATLSFAPLAFANYGNWTVLVDDGGGISPTISSVATIMPPTFAITPLAASATAPIGVAHNLTVSSTASSGQTGYQWRFNGVNLAKSANIANPTSQTMTINSMRSPDNVGGYSVIVNDGFHYLTSNVQNLTIAANPGVTSALSAGLVNLQFPSEVGPTYVIEYKGALTNGAWTTLTTTNGTGLPIDIITSPTNGTQRYFRIRMQ